MYIPIFRQGNNAYTNIINRFKFNKYLINYTFNYLLIVIVIYYII